MSDITIRKATELDMENIFLLQIEVFEGEQGIPADDVPLSFDKSPQMWCAEKDGKIIGAVTAWLEDYEVHWGRFAVEPDFRGQHIGTKLAKFSFETLFSQGAYRINIEARDETVRIIQSMGGKITGEPTMFYDAPVTPMILEKEKFNPKY